MTLGTGVCLLNLTYEGFSLINLSFLIDSGGGDLCSGGGGDRSDVVRSPQPVSARGERSMRGEAEVAPNRLRPTEVESVEASESVTQRERINQEISCETREKTQE